MATEDIFEVDLSRMTEINFKNRSMATEDIFEVDLGHAAVLVADENGRAGNIFKARVYNPKLIGVVRIDRDCRRDIFELVVYESKSSFVFADSGFALPVKCGINQRELPCRRRFAGHDTELATMEMKILSLVGHLVKAGKSRTDIEVDVAEIAVLCGVKADCYSAAVAWTNFEIDIAHR